MFKKVFLLVSVLSVLVIGMTGCPWNKNNKDAPKTENTANNGTQGNK